MNVALVTGSSRGIGAACASALARTAYAIRPTWRILRREKRWWNI